MTLSQLRSGERVFIDANIFLYHFTGVSEECKEFLKRCEAGDLYGVTGLTVMAEVCHRLMIAEAIRRGLIRSSKPVAQLQRKPEVVRMLSEYSAEIMNITGWGILVMDLEKDALMQSQVYRTQFGLLTNDSFILVYMRIANTDKLATNDKAFARIPSIRVYSPSDIS
jgi:predicted nucleic acid-binding protein